MEYKIITYKEEEVFFAEVQTKAGEQICVADNEDEYEAIKEACLVFVDILDDFEKSR